MCSTELLCEIMTLNKAYSFTLMCRSINWRGRHSRRVSGKRNCLVMVILLSIALDQYFQVSLEDLSKGKRECVAFPLSVRSIPNKNQCRDRVSVQDCAWNSMKTLLPSRN